MKYASLLQKLSEFSQDQLLCDVTIYDTETQEYKPAKIVSFTTENDVLDANHPYILV